MAEWRHAGVLAHSVPGAARCFSVLCESGMASVGGHRHPDVSLDCIAMGHSMPAWESGDLARVRSLLETSVARLSAAGCDFFVCPDNTAHLALEEPGPDLALPGIHIAQVVARQAQRSGFHQVGLLGTAWTMEADMYPRELERVGVSCMIPAPDERAVIQDLTFSELTRGVFRDETRAVFVDIVRRLANAGCEGVALACTE